LPPDTSKDINSDSVITPTTEALPCLSGTSALKTLEHAVSETVKLKTVSARNARKKKARSIDFIIWEMLSKCSGQNIKSPIVQIILQLRVDSEDCIFIAVGFNKLSDPLGPLTNSPKQAFIFFEYFTLKFLRS
jgi:hypothetical protein